MLAHSVPCECKASLAVYSVGKTLLIRLDQFGRPAESGDLWHA